MEQGPVMDHRGGETALVQAEEDVEDGEPGESGRGRRVVELDLDGEHGGKPLCPGSVDEPGREVGPPVAVQTAEAVFGLPDDLKQIGIVAAAGRLNREHGGEPPDGARDVDAVVPRLAAVALDEHWRDGPIGEREPEGVDEGRDHELDGPRPEGVVAAAEDGGAGGLVQSERAADRLAGEVVCGEFLELLEQDAPRDEIDDEMMDGQEEASVVIEQGRHQQGPALDVELLAISRKVLARAGGYRLVLYAVVVLVVMMETERPRDIGRDELLPAASRPCEPRAKHLVSCHEGSQGGPQLVQGDRLPQSQEERLVEAHGRSCWIGAKSKSSPGCSLVGTTAAAAAAAVWPGTSLDAGSPAMMRAMVFFWRMLAVETRRPRDRAAEDTCMAVMESPPSLKKLSSRPIVPLSRFSTEAQMDWRAASDVDVGIRRFAAALGLVFMFNAELLLRI
ncbi:hypothetical protein ColKHC_04416 [Colletotrichum higginsianum]|nr:hypothetical protein ColKHC_04416 [Colletotrichum higginsianum]